VADEGAQKEISVHGQGSSKCSVRGGAGWDLRAEDLEELRCRSSPAERLQT